MGRHVYRWLAFVMSPEHEAEIARDAIVEAMIYDADFPSQSVRFLVPKGFRLAGGIYEIRRVRTATPEDDARWAGLPDPPEYWDDEPFALLKSEQANGK